MKKQETYSVGGREFPIVGQAKMIDQNREVVGTIQIADIPQVSDYKWQLDCLNDRLQHPEKYAPFEDVEEHIAQLRQWLATHKEKTTKTA